MQELMMFQNQPVEIIDYHGTALFNPYHVGKCLELSESGLRNHLAEMNQKQAITLKNSDVLNLDFRKLNNRGEKFITKSGVYKLIFKSHKPDAEKFQDWVTDVVLPQIEKTGGYIPITKDDDEKTIMAKGYMVAMKTIEAKDELIKQLKPKADEYDAFINSKGYISLNKTAKALKVGRNKMMAFLRHWSILFIDGQDNLPYQKYVTAGYFTIDCRVGRDGKVHATTRVSPKGVSFIHKLYLKYAPSIERTVA